MNQYYDFNGYCIKTTDELFWGLCTDCVTDKEITLIFNSEGECVGVEKAEDVRILISIEDIPRYAEFSIRGGYKDE